MEEEEFDVYTHLLVSSFLVPGGGERGKGREGRNVGRLTSASDEAGNVVIVEAVDALEIPGISRLVGEEEERKGGAYICPPPHCTSSTISKLLCTMNWFICLACSGKRAIPSPPCFEVPNSCSKRGLSCVPIMAK